MAGTDFAALLSKKVDETKKPPALPAGTYRSSVVRTEFGESDKKKTPYCRFFIKPNAPEADVDPTAFEEFGGLAALQKKEMRIDQWMTDDSMYRLKDFLTDTLGLNCEGRSFGEVIPESVNCELFITVAHKPSDDGKEIYANITGTARVE